MARFRLVPGQSRVAIHARSSVHPIAGEATGLTGLVEVAVAGAEPDLSVPARARIELAVADLSSGNPLYDTEMRRRLDARRHPTIVGELTAVAPSGDGRYLVTGDLTFHGVTRRVDVELTAAFDGDGVLHAAWEQVIDIRDFGLRPPRVLMLKVHPDVRVEVSLVAERERG